MDAIDIENIVHEARSGLLPFRIIRIKFNELQEFVAIALKEDEDLITKYHFQDETMEELIVNNVKNIVELSKTKEVKLYGIFLEDTPIGFTVICEKLLFSFGINVYCRQGAVVQEWVHWLKKTFNGHFMVCLYRENTRAINFFLRNGCEEFSEEGNVVYLLYSN